MNDTSLARTQKAKGIRALEAYGQEYSSIYRPPSPILVLPLNLRELPIGELRKVAEMSKPFLRPCPERPRHGFVESRVETGLTLGTLLDVAEEVRGQDPNGELLVMPYVQAVANFVLTPGRLVIGAGHDGATAGKGAVTIAFAVGDYWLDTNLTHAAGIPENEAPYLEGVIDAGGRTYLTQLRAGPVVPTTIDFIPVETRVEAVVKAEGDLITWEQRTAAFTPGTVVWHPDGALTSHYGIHCINHKIPVIVSHEPKVGEVLEPIDTQPPDYASIADGIIAAQAIEMSTAAGAGTHLTTGLIGFHHTPFLSGRGSLLTGYGIGLLHRLGIAACIGEARHHVSLPPNSGKGSESRETVYTRAFYDVHKARNAGFPDALIKFADLDWSTTSCGGPPWLQCARATAALDQTIHVFLRDPDDRHYRQMMDEANRVVNLAHYGGWWLNKFAADHVFTQTQKLSVDTLLGSIPSIWMALNVPGIEPIFENTRKAVLAWPPLDWDGLKTRPCKTTYHARTAEIYSLALEGADVLCVLAITPKINKAFHYLLRIPKPTFKALCLEAAKVGMFRAKANHDSYQVGVMFTTDTPTGLKVSGMGDELEQTIVSYADPSLVLWHVKGSMPWPTVSEAQMLDTTRTTWREQGLGDSLYQQFKTRLRERALAAANGVPPKPLPQPVEEDEEEPYAETCNACDKGLYEDDVYWGADDKAYCEACFDAKWPYTCAGCSEKLTASDAYTSPNSGDHLCEPCFDARFTVCEGCSEPVANDTITETDSGAKFCTSCYQKHLDEQEKPTPTEGEANALA